MKKIFVLLVMLLSFPIFVKAEESVVITKVELENKTDSTIVIEEPTFNIRKINFNLKFSEVGDYAEYKVTLKNNSDKDYEIKNENNYLDSEYIKYEFSYGDSNILKAKEEKTIYIRLIYNKKVSEEHFVDGKYILNDSVKLDLVNDYIVVKVPPTYRGYSMFMVILGILFLTISFILLILNKDKKVKTLLLICLLIIPFTVLALESISLDVDIKIEVDSKFTGTIYRSNTTWAKIGNSIVPASGTKYVITDGETVFPAGPYESQNECQTAIEDLVQEMYASSEGKYCELQTGTYGGVGEYTTDRAEISSQFFLKHDVVDDIITASYVCFTRGTEIDYCLQGGDNGLSYSLNTSVLQTAFDDYDCTDFNSSYSCYRNLLGANVRQTGRVNVYAVGHGCSIAASGDSHCND